MATKGYPGEYQKGTEIKGLGLAGKEKNAVIFHAGTKKDGEKIVASGGRVLGVAATGKNVAEAVHNAVVLEFVARLAIETLRINPKTNPMPSALRDKHFHRKHGTKAYYGQK